MFFRAVCKPDTVCSEQQGLFVLYSLSSNNKFFLKLNSQTCPLLSLECNLACGAGYVANATCNGCDISDICVADNPCLNNGMCTLTTPPSDYSCNCTGTNNYDGANCESKHL